MIFRAGHMIIIKRDSTIISFIIKELLTAPYESLLE